MSASVHFSIRFDGPALETHQMDVRELAPALFALSTLLEEANKAAYPDAPEVRVNVQGNFKGGSFGIDLTAVQSIADQIVSIFSGSEATAAANLFGILGGLGLLGTAGGGLIHVIRWLAGRKPTQVKLKDEKAVFEVDETTRIDRIEVDLIAGRLYQSRIVRQSLLKVLKPLERDGIDYFACGRDGKAEVVIESVELPVFELAANEVDVVSDSLLEGVLLQIESAVFKQDNKWRFSDGTTSFYADIDDLECVERINSGAERFGKGDILVVDLRRIQSITDNGLKLENLIVRVREHREPLQGALFARR